MNEYDFTESEDTQREREQGEKERDSKTEIGSMKNLLGKGAGLGRIHMQGEGPQLSSLDLSPLGTRLRLCL